MIVKDWTNMDRLSTNETSAFNDNILFTRLKTALFWEKTGLEISRVWFSAALDALYVILETFSSNRLADIDKTTHDYNQQRPHKNLNNHAEKLVTCTSQSRWN